MIEKSNFGLALMAIRGNEEVAQVLGLRIRRYKILAFVISAFSAGVVGGVWSIYMAYMNPSSSLA